MPQKGKGTSKNESNGFISYFAEQGGETIFVGVVTSKKRLSRSNPPHANIPNFNTGQPCSHCNTYGHDAKQSFVCHLELQQGKFHTYNVNKSIGS
jgi:hypothetical protein